MFVTVFRSRLNPDHVDEYNQLAPEMSAAAAAMPGYISHKSFTADDGERVTIVEFADQESHRGWASDPRHRSAMAKGRDRLYLSYDLKVCRVERISTLSNEPGKERWNEPGQSRSTSAGDPGSQ
jgi:heme-degrading monooxygenase HmoA